MIMRSVGKMGYIQIKIASFARISGSVADMMTVTVNEKIVIENPTQAIQEYCKTELVLNNPEYIKKERMGLWTRNCPQTIQLYERLESGRKLVLPFGCLQDVWSRCVRGVTWKPEFAKIRQLDYKSHIKLYPYQEKAAEVAISKRNGVIVMPCGSGKTQTALEIISRIGGTCLWLTHTQDLLNQSMNRAKSVLDVDLNTYGTITGGKVNTGRGITFATVQTMAKIDLKSMRDSFDIIVVDECHKAIGSPTKVMQFYKVLSSLCARYKFGLTATPKRADGLQRSMFALLGNVIHEVKRSEVAHTTCPVKVKIIDTGYIPNEDKILMGDGTLNYASLVADMVGDSNRFQCVSNVLEALDGSALVLGNRVEYLERLQKEYDKRHGGLGSSVCISAIGNSKSAKQLRKNALKALNDGDIDCVFATYQLAKEGLDVPNLRYLVLATPEKDETTVMQSIGRVARKADGKEFGTVVDFDDSFGMYKGWLKKRMDYYNKIGAEVLDY